MKYCTLLAAAALGGVPSDGQVIVWDDAPTSVLPERRTKDTQVPLNVPELNGTMQHLFADVSSLKTGLATASSKVAAINAKVQPPAQTPSGLVAAPAPAPAPASVVLSANRREDGLPEQGFEGEDVEHEDGETKTDDWGEEYGPESNDEDNAEENEENHVAMHSKARGALRHGLHRRQRKHVAHEDGLPEQGFEGEDVEHKDGETKTDDWGEEYGPESSDEDNAEENEENHVAMHSKARGAHRHRLHQRQRKHDAQEDGLPEQGFEGEDVEHKDGETKTDDWGEEYGPESDSFHPDDADEQDAAKDEVAMHVKARGTRHRSHRQQAHGRRHSRGRGGKHLRVRREAHEDQDDTEEAPSFLQSKAAPETREYYAPWFGAPGNAPSLLDQSIGATSGGGFPLPGAAVEAAVPRRDAQSGDVERKESFLQRSAAAPAALEAREYYAPWLGAPGNAPEAPAGSSSLSGGGFPLPGAATVAEPTAAPEQGFEGEDVEHKDGETYTGDWQEEHGQSTEQTTAPPSTTAAAP